MDAHGFAGAQPLTRLTFLADGLFQVKINSWLIYPFTVYKDFECSLRITFFRTFEDVFYCSVIKVPVSF